MEAPTRRMAATPLPQVTQRHFAKLRLGPT